MPSLLLQELQSGKKLSEIIKKKNRIFVRDELVKNEYDAVQEAARNGDIATLTDLLNFAKEEKILEVMLKSKAKILRQAAEKGQLEAMQKIVEIAKSSSPALASEILAINKFEVLQIATEAGNLDMVEFLLTNGGAPADLADWVSVLCNAAKSGNQDVFDRVSKSIEEKFKGNAPKPFTSKETDPMQVLDAILDSLRTNRPQVASALLDFVTIYGSNKFEEILLTKGESSKEEKARLDRMKPGGFSQGKVSKEKAAPEAEEKFKILVTALKKGHNEFFIKALESLRTASLSSVQAAVAYIHDGKEVLKNLAKGDEKVLDAIEAAGKPKTSPKRQAEEFEQMKARRLSKTDKTAAAGAEQ